MTEGALAILIVYVSGNPSPDVYWRKGKKDITNVGKYRIVEGGNLQVSHFIVFDWLRNGANGTEAFVKGHFWCQNDDYVGGATCRCSNCLCFSGREMVPTGQRPLLMDILGTKMMIMWELLIWHL